MVIFMNTTNFDAFELNLQTLYCVLLEVFVFLESDACQSGMAKCDMNEECVPSEDGYTCSCVSGYKNKGDGCKKAGKIFI